MLIQRKFYQFILEFIEHFFQIAVPISSKVDKENVQNLNRVDRGYIVSASPYDFCLFVVLRHPVVSVSTIEKAENIEFTPGRTRAMAKGTRSYLGMNKVDLTNINSIEFAAGAFGAMGPAIGGIIEIHLDSPDGKLIGTTPEITPPLPGTGRRGGRGSRVKADINEVNGLHDLYFVFVNNKATNTVVLLSVMDIKFNE